MMNVIGTRQSYPQAPGTNPLYHIKDVKKKKKILSKWDELSCWREERGNQGTLDQILIIILVDEYFAVADVCFFRKLHQF